MTDQLSEPRRAALRLVAQWLLLGALVGALCGAASALFLCVLQQATNFRTSHQIIVYGLPVAGALVGLVYERFGRSIAGGNNLIIDTIHDDGPRLPLRMAPASIRRAARRCMASTSWCPSMASPRKISSPNKPSPGSSLTHRRSRRR